MISSYEVRKGNLFIYNGNVVTVGGMSYSDFDNDHDMEWLGVQIKKLGDEEIYFDNQKIYTNGAFVEPIPLTPEILIDWCGFLNRNDFYEKNINEINFCWDEETGLDFAYDGAGISFPMTDIKNLHQLQNLYFAFTGIELELKIPQKA